MNNLPILPPCMIVKIINPIQVIGVANQYTATLKIRNQEIEGSSGSYSAADVSVGYCVSNFEGGQAWKIIDIFDVNLALNTMTSILEDVEYYNYLMDQSTGEHGPNDGQLGYCFTLGENGLPNLFPIDPIPSFSNQH